MSFHSHVVREVGESESATRRCSVGMEIAVFVDHGSPVQLSKKQVCAQNEQCSGYAPHYAAQGSFAPVRRMCHLPVCTSPPATMPRRRRAPCLTHLCCCALAVIRFGIGSAVLQSASSSSSTSSFASLPPPAPLPIHARAPIPAPPPLPQLRWPILTPPRGATTAGGSRAVSPTPRRGNAYRQSSSTSERPRLGGVRLHRVPSPLRPVSASGEPRASQASGAAGASLNRQRSRSDSPLRTMDEILGAMGSTGARDSTARIGVAMAVGAGTAGLLQVGSGGGDGGDDGGSGTGLLRFRALEFRVLLRNVRVD